MTDPIDESTIEAQAATNTAAPKKRTMSAEAKRKISEKMKARWAERTANPAKETAPAAEVKPVEPVAAQVPAEVPAPAPVAIAPTPEPAPVPQYVQPPVAAPVEAERFAPYAPIAPTPAATPIPAAPVETSAQPVAAAAPVAPRPEQPRHEPAPPVFGEGIVEVSGKGFGFLRDPKRNFVQNPQDIFVTPEIVRRYNLRDGMWLKGEIRRGGRGPQLFRLTEVNGDDPEKCRNLPAFDELTVVSPDKRIKLETVPERYTTRIMDMMTPIGKGQRGLIVAPPRTGKTTLLQHIADAVVKNHPEIKLIMLLVDERPEELTEIRRTVPTAEIMASSNDSDLKSHTRIAQLAIDRARRLVEAGKDVFVLLDSITRVGRAFNNSMGGGGRTMSGGIDARALEIPRKLFASARNTEEAGSLTIIATALIETGSRMDELIFQEFKGTGNMELVLDRKISDLRIYPAVDIFKSGTRREELLLPAEDLHKINVIRRGLSGHKPEEAIERLLSFVKKFPTNAIMLREIPG
jgi:transcription termination factor Rho